MNFDFNGDGNVNALDKSVYVDLFNYYLAYADTDKSVTRGDTLNAGETKHMKLVIEYKDTATKLPEKNLTLTSSDPITITYEQKD
ncbi:unknown [Clostridium sp. CAG:594]|nr:unknown [Clostridium sp. CAG:594]